MQGIDETFHVGRTPYADPFLVSTLLSVQLPLFPCLKIDPASKFSIDIVHDLLAGLVDLAIAHEPPESPLLTCVQVAEQPFYIAMAKRDALASNPSVSLDQMDGRHWILFERQLHPPVYDAIILAATQQGVRPWSIQHVIAPEEAFPFVSDGSALAFVVKAGALLMARNGVTVRPLKESNLRLKTWASEMFLPLSSAYTAMQHKQFWDFDDAGLASTLGERRRISYPLWTTPFSLAG